MDLALARIRNNIGQLRGSIQRPTQDSMRTHIGERVKIAHPQYYFGAALLAALVGIAVNALLLQHERHPAPLFGASSARVSDATSTPAPSPQSVQEVAQRSPTAEDNAATTRSSVALPPIRPQDAASDSSLPPDPIANLLAGEGHGDSSHLILSAQAALAKLGYPVKVDGKEGSATEQALRDFERAHGLPPTTELTERLVKQLTAAARAGGR